MRFFGQMIVEFHDARPRLDQRSRNEREAWTSSPSIPVIDIKEP